MRDVKFMIAAIAAVVISNGVGRFAYTPILPLMQSQAHLTHTLAGILASANLTGYLIGAFVASQGALRRHRLAIIVWGTAACVVATGFAALPMISIWLATRFVTGLVGGTVFVLISSVVLDRAARERKPWLPAISFGGVGGGIVLSGILVPFFGRIGGWQGAWIGLCCVAALFALTLGWLRAESSPPEFEHHEPVALQKGSGLFVWLFVVYGVEGLGYIIPATFMVAIIAGTPAVAGLASLAWIIVGLIAVFAPLVWSRIGTRLGRGRALIVCLALQAAGIAAPALLHNAAGAIIGAIGLGATFNAIGMLANGLGRELYPVDSHVAVGRLTASYGIGQIVGPLLATALTLRSGNYDWALLVAAAAVAASAVVMTFGISMHRAHERAALR